MVTKEKTQSPLLRFSLKAIFLLMLLVCTFFAGRASMMPRLLEAEKQRDAVRQLSELRRQEMQAVLNNVRVARLPANSSLSPGIRGIEEGMMMDAMEHQQRHFPTKASGTADY
jgi:hypothetical protein